MLGNAPKTPFLYDFWNEEIFDSPLKSVNVENDINKRAWQRKISIASRLYYYEGEGYEK